MNDEEGVLTTVEVAEILRIHHNTVLKLIGTGRLKAFKLERRYRIRREDLDNFMEGDEEHGD